MKLLQSCVGNYLFHISLEFKRRRETTDSCLSFWGRVQSSPHSTVGDRRQLNTNSRTSETTNIWRQCWGGSRNVQRGRKEGDVKFKYVWVFILGSNNKTLTKADSFERLLRGHWFVSNMGSRDRRNKCSDDSPVSPLALYSAKSIALYASCMKKGRWQRFKGRRSAQIFERSYEFRSRVSVMVGWERRKVQRVQMASEFCIAKCSVAD